MWRCEASRHQGIKASRHQPLDASGQKAVRDSRTHMISEVTDHVREQMAAFTFSDLYFFILFLMKHRTW